MWLCWDNNDWKLEHVLDWCGLSVLVLLGFWGVAGWLWLIMHPIRLKGT